MSFKKRFKETPHPTANMVMEWLEEAEKEFPGFEIGTALEGTHTGKRGRPKKYIPVVLSSPGQVLDKTREWFETWFGENE